jgi:hypothetical protein
LNISNESVPKIENTPTMTTDALVTSPAVDLIPMEIVSATPARRWNASRIRLAMKHVIVHREPEQDHEEQLVLG